MANVSYHYFVKLFRKTMGLSFLEYVNYKKIKRAERILLTKDLSIAQVGEEIGMTNMAHFYKMFKKHNQCSPNEYRKKLQTWMIDKDSIDNQAAQPPLLNTGASLPEPEEKPVRKPRKPPAIPKDELYNCFGSHS